MFFKSKPKWKNRNWRIRLEAVQSFSLDDALLIQLAKTDVDWHVRQAAVEKLYDQPTLLHVAEKDTDPDVRICAIKRITDSYILKQIAQEEQDERVKKEINRRLGLDVQKPRSRSNVSDNTKSRDNTSGARQNMSRKFDEFLDTARLNLFLLKPPYGEHLQNELAYERCTTAYKDALKIEPNDKQVWNELAEVFIVAEDHKKALWAIENALKIDQRYTAPMWRLGEVLEKLKRFDELEACYRQIAEIDSEQKNAVERRIAEVREKSVF